MNEEMKEYLKNLYTYLTIMNNVNIILKNIINTNIKNSPEKNMDMFYYLVSEIIRVMAYSYNEKTDILYLKFDGIMLLKEKITCLEECYMKILNKPSIKKSLISIYKVRNKFIHEPHNLSFGYSVGAKTSCSMGIYYMDELQELSTIDLQVIIKELNIIYIDIKQEFINIVKKCDKEYIENPLYKKVLSYQFEKYNNDITILPKYFDK